MNIGVQLDKHEFLYDIHSLVKSFFPDDDVNIYTDEETEKCGTPRDLLLKVEIPEGADRREVKGNLAREIYAALSDMTGDTLPWGTLSGVRPTKIPLKMLSEGHSREEIHDYMSSWYLCSDEKIELATRVAERELEILKDVPTGPQTWSLYVNVPFCPTICLYCTFSSSPIKAWKKRVGEYLSAVSREMKKKRQYAIEHGMLADPVTVYIGGGTPTTLEPDELEILLRAIETTFDLSGLIEYTVEAGRPDSITPEKLAVLKKHGVTRISVNPQTMNQKTLDVIGRHHTVEETVRAFHDARNAGFTNINMDMILGLPGEEEAEVVHTLEEIDKLKPDSLTVHSLAVKRASRLRKTIREDREQDENADRGNYEGLAFKASLHLMNLAQAEAKRLNMEPYYLYRQKNMRGNLENTGFAVPGTECLYNILIMEEVQTILACGCAASTKFVYPGGLIEREINTKDLKTYLERMAEE